MTDNQWIIGKTYIVHHQRKGTFKAKIIEVTDEYATIELVEGAVNLLSKGLVKKGDIFDVRKSFCRLEEIIQ